MGQFKFDPRRLLRYPAPEIEFIAALVHKQGGDPDVLFCRRLGVSRALWGAVRKGDKPLGVKLLVGAADLVSHPVYEAAERSVLRRVRWATTSEDVA